MSRDVSDSLPDRDRHRGDVEAEPNRRAERDAVPRHSDLAAVRRYADGSAPTLEKKRAYAQRFEAQRAESPRVDEARVERYAEALVSDESPPFTARVGGASFVVEDTEPGA